MTNHEYGEDLDRRTIEAMGLLVRRRELRDTLANLGSAAEPSGPSSAAEEYERLHAFNRENDARAELEVVERKLRELGVDLEEK